MYVFILDQCQLKRKYKWTNPKSFQLPDSEIIWDALSAGKDLDPACCNHHMVFNIVVVFEKHLKNTPLSADFYRDQVRNCLSQVKGFNRLLQKWKTPNIDTQLIKPTFSGIDSI